MDEVTSTLIHNEGREPFSQGTGKRFNMVTGCGFITLDYVTAAPFHRIDVG